MRFIILILLLLVAFPANGEEYNNEVNFCSHTIRITEPEVLICHRGTISDVEINNAHAIVTKARKLYPDFADSHKINSNISNNIIVIVILTPLEMNDPEIFHNYSIGEKAATARFMPKEKIICVSPSALRVQDPNLPHELAHLFNAYSNIIDRQRDELLAYDFERFFFSR